MRHRLHNEDIEPQIRPMLESALRLHLPPTDPTVTGASGHVLRVRAPTVKDPRIQLPRNRPQELLGANEIRALPCATRKLWCRHAVGVRLRRPPHLPSRYPRDQSPLYLSYSIFSSLTRATLSLAPTAARLGPLHLRRGLAQRGWPGC